MTTEQLAAIAVHILPQVGGDAAQAAEKAAQLIKACEQKAALRTGILKAMDGLEQDNDGNMGFRVGNVFVQLPATHKDFYRIYVRGKDSGESQARVKAWMRHQIAAAKPAGATEQVMLNLVNECFSIWKENEFQTARSFINQGEKYSEWWAAKSKRTNTERAAKAAKARWPKKSR